jgi:cytochrome c-type biogenesis protein CcmH
MRTLSLTLLLCLVTALHAAAQLSTDPAERVANEAIREIRSPYCPGLMLEVCPSEPAEALRDSIRDMAAAGMSSRAIIEDVIARHGEEWRGLPRRSGVALWAWLLPPLALLGGGVFLLVRLRAMRRAGPDAAPVPVDDAADPGLSPDERAQLDDALRDWEAREEAGL